MRKMLLFVLILALAAGLLAAAGCGGGDEEAVEVIEEETVVSTDETLEEGIVGVFVEGNDPKAKTGRSLSIIEDGEWQGNAWGSEQEGTYNLEEEPARAIIFSFEGGSTEKWSVMTGDGKVYAIVSPEGDQFTKYQK